MSASTQLSQIPKEDREKIEGFFSYLIFDEGFAYSLFGSKPMSTIGHDKTTPSSYKELYPHPLFELEEWWQTWERYSHLFPMQNYLLFAQNGEEWFEVFLLNKSSCLEIIENNLSLFIEKIGVSLEPVEIFELILSSSNLFSEGLQQSQALFGLLLGYGKENSMGFEKQFSKKRAFNHASPMNSIEVVAVDTNALMVPCFSSYSHKETWEIMKQYEKERDGIIQVYSCGDFLEITLNKLTS